VLFRSLGPGRVVREGVAARTSPDNVVDITAVLGGFERRVSAQDFRGGEITAVMGGCALDLRDASIVKEAVINVFAIWGGITIKVPARLDRRPAWHAGDGRLRGKDRRPPDASKRLVITGYAIMGGVEVRN
jgi:hypothetical protein